MVETRRLPSHAAGSGGSCRVLFPCSQSGPTPYRHTVCCFVLYQSFVEFTEPSSSLALATIYVQLGRVEDALGLLESEHAELHLPIAMETAEECTSGDGSELTRPQDQPDYTLEVRMRLPHVQRNCMVLLYHFRLNCSVSN